MSEAVEKPIRAYECKHAAYVKGEPKQKGGVPDDLVFIKERIHYEDGTTAPNTRLVKNYKRPFWTTKPGFQNHEEKKEYEHLERLDRYETTQANLEPAIKKALKLFTPKGGLRKLATSPYLYGADISSTAIIKYKYMEKYPDIFAPNYLAILDIETDVVDMTQEPILISITFGHRAILAATKRLTDRVEGDFKEQLQQHFHKRLPETIKERGIELEIVTVNDPLEAIKAVMKRCHEWQPDFLAVWNVNFDIPRILEMIENFGGDPGDIFSDPSVPREFRKCRYKEGASKKITASGKEEPLHWVDRWHVFFCPASFYVVDQACVFRILRRAKPREPSYALDAILTRHAGIRKLKNEKADEMSGLQWHQYMQQHEPLEYSVYNLYDCISCEILDEQPKVGDLRASISIQCGHSDFANFNSQPRRMVDDLHFECLNDDKVIATTPEDIETEFDSKTVGIDGWIVTLPAHMIENNGRCNIEEMPDAHTALRNYAYDSDVTSAYPTGEDILNASKTTTVAERHKIEGLTEDQARRLGINLTGGSTNATEICQSALALPGFEELLEHFEENRKK